MIASTETQCRRPSPCEIRNVPETVNTGALLFLGFAVLLVAQKVQRMAGVKRRSRRSMS